jgi:magnesium transporter
MPHDRWYCAVWLQAEGRTQRVKPDEVEAYLEKGVPLWLDILGPTEEETVWLDETFGFHPLALSDLLNNDVRPKQESYGDVLFTVFSALNLNPGEDPLDTINLNLFLTPAYLVTTHLQPVKTIRSVRENIEKKHSLFSKGTDFLYYTILDGVIDRYVEVLEVIEDEIDETESIVFGEEETDIQRRIFASKSKIAHLRRSIGPKRDALHELVYREFPQIQPGTRTQLRDVLDHVQRISDRLETYRELLNGLMESYMVRLSNRMNEVMKLLSVIATLILPLSFVTGIFGMNFDAIPGLHSEGAFWTLIAGMGFLAAGMLWLFKRKRIL